MPRQKKGSPVKRVSTLLDKTDGSVTDISDDCSNSQKKIKYERNNYCTIYKVGLSNKRFFLGKLKAGVSNNVFPEEWEKCKIAVVENKLKMQFDDDSHAIIQNISDIKLIEDVFSIRVFKFDLSITASTEVFISLYFSELPLVKFTKRITHVIQQLIVQFFNVDMSDVYQESKIKTHENIEELYSAVSDYRESKLDDSALDVNLQHPHLLPKLRPYQYSAVKWMINKEKKSEEKTGFLHPLYTPLTLETGLEIYYNKYTGYIEITKPLVEYTQSGGILADEMGLGKTVEVLACILNNPRVLHESHSTKSIEILNNSEVLEESQSAESTQTLNFTLPETSNGSIDQESEQDLDETIPTIETQLKYIKPKIKYDHKKIKQVAEKSSSKRKKGKDRTEKAEGPGLKTKMKKGGEKMPAIKIAQIWYNNKLAEVAIRKKNTIKSTEEVQCICGDFTNKGVVTCCKCKKVQHALCMNYKQDDKLYCCPQCWTKKPLIKSRATLIVSPLPISRQWSLEVQRHIRKNGLKVLEYKGIHSAGMIYPTTLAEYDIVITTYNVLQSELKFTNEEQGSISLRYAKRYTSPNTPLVFIEWWRLCLDEAQNVECPTSQVSCMARQLNVIHRWAVTGTPIQKNIRDLYGLVDYLQLAPYDNVTTWNCMLYFPYVNGRKQQMIEFLSKIMWRSAKNDVIEQINIPVQTVEEHWLEFSAVEKFFYSREHESCANMFLSKLRTFPSLDVTLKSVDRHALNLLLAPLLSLRQACTHPYAVRGRYLTSKRQVNSMEDLLEVLIKKNVKDCEESLRAIMAALNGMAGVLLLQQRSLEAVEKYREALNYISQYDNSDFLKIDKLQRIHTLHNLNDVLTDKSYPAPPPTLRDDKLEEECEVVQCKYMEKYISQTLVALKEVKKATENVEDIKSTFILDEGEWCAELLDWIVEQSLEDEFVKRINNLAGDSNFKLKPNITTGARALMYFLITWVDNVNKNLDKVRSLFKDFEKAFRGDGENSYIKPEVVESAMECHLRPAKTKKPPPDCKCCVLDKNLKKYECIIFRMSKKANKENASNEGNWHPSVEEKILQFLCTFGRSKGADEDLLLDAETHVSLCKSRRKEFKELRKLYTFYDQQVSAQDELNICKIRFRLRNPEEPVKVIQKKKNILENLDYEIKNKYEFIHVMSDHELDYNHNLLREEKAVNEEKLKKCLGTHNYLKTLRNQQYSGQNPDPCPICNVQLSESWSILQCGHCYCLDCIHKLLEQYRLGNNVTCCVCRKKQLCSDISYIKVKGGSENTIDDVQIKGSYSTKVHAIIGCVLKLRESDADVKILIFSTWQAVLKILSEAFTANEISHEFISSIHLQDKLKNFKDKNKKITALLLPVRLGANGLNLIEATHVILVEPLMNPGEELQAIGRVHRIGQTKQTVVHRFLINNTMEENIHNAISANAEQWDNNKLTLCELKGLFTQTECDPDQQVE